MAVKRMFDKIGSASLKLCQPVSDGPGSASLHGHMAYGGSRKEKNRWEYSEGAGAGFAELDKDHTPTEEEFFEMLQRVPGVAHVEWQSSKTSQGNPSQGHHMERNILVTSSLGPGSASHPFEFELTRNDHMKDPRLPITVTACFKEPSPELVPEAWRILTEAIKGREFAPKHIVKYKAKVLKKWANHELSSQLPPGGHAMKKLKITEPFDDLEKEVDWDWGDSFRAGPSDAAPDPADDEECRDPADHEMSHAFQQEVEKPVSDSSVASLEQALLLEDARQELLPPFMQPSAQTWIAESSAFQAMQELKAREVEHVRWRAAQAVAYDPVLRFVETSMRTEARANIQRRVDLAELSATPGSASVPPAVFLIARHSEKPVEAAWD